MTDAATRESYGKALAELGKQFPDIVALDADLSGSTKSSVFAKEFPERFFNVGIAEQNLIGTAAGLALAGKKVFASTFAVFITGRVYDIVRQSVCYADLPVKLVGSHGGIMTGEDGPTHHATEDFSLMRSLPNMNVVCPCDEIETIQATKFLASYDKPCYMRTCRQKTPAVNSADYKFEFAKGVLLKEGTDATIVAVGSMVYIALHAALLLHEKGISTRVINIHTLKPLDKQIILSAAKETRTLITAEDHQIIGGLGSAVAEILAENQIAVPFKRIGVHGFTESASPEALYKKYGFTPENLAEETQRLLK